MTAPLWFCSASKVTSARCAEPSGSSAPKGKAGSKRVTARPTKKRIIDDGGDSDKDDDVVRWPPDSVAVVDFDVGPCVRRCLRTCCVSACLRCCPPPLECRWHRSLQLLGTPTVNNHGKGRTLRQLQ